MQGHEHGLACQ